MKHENDRPGRNIDGKAKPYYPDCAGQGGGASGHCGKGDCPVCTVFGFAKRTDPRRIEDPGGGFAGLAAFSDMHVLLFPVGSQLGPQWITCPMALRQLYGDNSQSINGFSNENAIYRKEKVEALNLGWLLLPVETDPTLDEKTAGLNQFEMPKYVKDRLGVVSDKLFTHIVNSNLEVRTSVAISPATGAAEDGALFTYEVLPRGTVLVWELTCRNPKHFKIDQKDIKLQSPEEVKDVVADAHSYLEHLGIGGMGSRGMGRLRVLATKEPDDADKSGKEVS
jgi:CRISPR-associated protein Cmr4